MCIRDRVRSAGLDVYADEPASNKALYSHPMVSCTPHIGAATVEAQKDVYKRQIFNVAAGSATAEIVAEIRAQYPDMPIMATGGPSDESILRTIDAGANAITYNPPSSAELFKHTMERYRMGLPYE